MIRCIDTHVHFRDWQERYKETIRGGAERVARQGIIAIGDMPNTKPSVLTMKDVVARLNLAREQKPPVQYFTWVGLTAYPAQIAEAVEAVRKILRAIGLKLYAGESVGSLGVIRVADQKRIYETLTSLDYRGVLAVHCERYDLLNTGVWDPKRPWTHEKARPIPAETEAIKDQIEIALSVGFTGHLHICHISCLESLNLVVGARDEGLDISCEITPHHALLNTESMKTGDGLRLKVNPPLREEKEQKELLQAFLHLARQEADWIFIATDYAPHAPEEKLNPPYLSGIADYGLYGEFLAYLENSGLTLPGIERLTYFNIKNIFGDKLKDI